MTATGVNLDYVDDPILAPKDAARYLGRATRTLRKLDLERSPMPGTGLEWGYRRSVLNRHLNSLAERYAGHHIQGV